MIKAPTISDIGVQAVAATVVHEAGSDPAEGDYYGARVVQRDAGVIDHVWQVTVTGRRADGVVIESVTPAIATVQDGLLSRVADGTAEIIVTHPLCHRRLSLHCYQVVGTTRTFLRWQSGSAMADAVDQVDTALALGTDTAMFSTLDHAAATYTRNASCWCAGADMAGAAVWNSGTGTGRGGGVAVTARHVLVAHHYSGAWPVGGTARWEGTDGVLVTRTIAAKVRVGQTDIAVVRLSEDLPATVSPMAVPPLAWADYAPSESAGYPLPVVCLSPDRHAYVGESTRIGLSSGWTGQPGELYSQTSVSLSRPTDATRLLAWEPAADSWSGGPWVLLTTGGPVLVGYYTTPTSGPWIAAYAAEIQAAIQATDPTYGLTRADWSSYDTVGGGA